MNFKNILTAVVVTAISFGIIFAANSFFGKEIASLVILLSMVFLISLQIGMRKKDKALNVSIKKMEVNAEGVAAFIQHISTPNSLSVVQKVNNFIQTPYSDLDPEAQVMKSEENALRVRLTETLKFLDSDTFKAWPEGKQTLLRQQAGAMLLYHGTLVSRCYDAGVLVNPTPSESSDSVPSDSANGE